MRFIADLISWFLHGRIEEPVATPVETEAPAPEEPVGTPEPTNVVQEILTDAQPERFLKELKSIQPIRKQFEKDRSEIEQEVKRLSNNRNRKHR